MSTARTTTPAAPADLSQAAAQLWDEVTSSYELEGADLSLLAEACKQLTRAHQAAAQVAEHGVCVTDRWGQLRDNPAVGIERQSVNQYRLLMRELGLDLDAPSEGPRLNRGRHYG
jgi:P27 family predicted phage terminase small subunit